MPHADLARRAVDLHRRYLATNELADLRESVELLRRAATAPEPKLSWVANLGAGLILLFERVGHLDLLLEGVATCRRVVALVPGNPAYLSNLAAALEMLYWQTSTSEVLDEAVRVAREAVAATPDDDRSLMMRLSNLSNSLRTQYVRTGDEATIREAVDVGERAVSMLDGTGDSASRLLSNLANATWDLATHNSDPEKLAAAVATFQKAFDATPESHPNRADVLSNLALRRAAAAVDLADVEAGVALARQALEWTDGQTPDRAHNEACLASTLRSRFNFTGEVSSLAEAAGLARSAMLRTQNDHKNLANRLVDYGTALRVLHERTHELALAQQAVEAIGTALSITSVEEPAHLDHLVDTANALLALYERTDDVDHARRAVELCRQAIGELDADHPKLRWVLIHAIAPMVALASETNDEALFGEAVTIGRRVAAVPDDDPEASSACSNAAYALRRRYAHTDDPDDAREAARYARRAANLIPSGSPHRPSALINLGTAQLDADLLDDARVTFTEATTTPAATLLNRIHAWWRLGRIESKADRANEAVTAFEEAIALLPQLSRRHLARGDHEFSVGQTTGLAAEAAAAAVRAGRFDHAVRLSEQARALVIAETLDARSDLRALREHHPELDREYQRLRDAIDAVDHPVIGDPVIGDYVAAPPSARREELVARWLDLVEHIRANTELRTFLLPPEPQVSKGPVVITYATRSEAGALVLRPGRPVDHVPLAISDIAAAEQADRFERGCLATAPARSYADRKAALDDMHRVLRWLWDNVTEPVLDHLGLGQPSDKDWPRVWWCPISAMGSLPLHAAGYHEDGLRRTVMDRVVSSYTTTLRTHARTPRTPTEGQVLIVAMPTTPGKDPLLSATGEADMIARLFPTATKLIDETATHDAVLEEIPRHSTVHIASHAVGDPRDPSASHLVLYDHATAPLIVAEISDLDLPDADLAFLSACNTTDAAPRLIDEAVHITGSFHLAGYRHVIGTLTPVNATAERVAAAVYSQLAPDGATAPATADTALALHNAVRLVREDHVDAPHTWATWIHVGI
ncbi:CHAT domain-containing protein [Amycolatopsis sp. WGS_07]|uniref:CHAT domain-containing protein n=1 Tax=Amycolatopsis sp. WGS_07 TaxID=3076764 RepID=UPI003872D934